MASTRVRSQQSQTGRNPAGTPSGSAPHRLDSKLEIEMENIQHQDLGLGGIIGAPSPPSRQAWSRDNPGFEPEEEIMEANWPPASPGRRSVSTASSSSCSSGVGSFTGVGGSGHNQRGGLYPSSAADTQRKDKHEHRSCMKQILQKIRSE